MDTPYMREIDYFYKQGLCAAYLLHTTNYESQKLELSQSRGDPLNCGTPYSSTGGPD